MLSFEGKRIDVGANKPKLRRFEIRAFCDKMRSFCTISASTFWKIQPEDGNETLIFKRFRLFWSRFDSSDCESPSKCFLLSNFHIPAYYSGNETLIFKRFRLFWSRFDSSDCESPSKCFLLSNFDIPAYYLAGFSKRLSSVTSQVSPVPPPPPSPNNFPVPSPYKNDNCLNIRTSLDILDSIYPRK